MTMELYKILEWDTAFFKFPVARITTEDISEHDVSKIFPLLQKNKVKLVYWSFNIKKQQLDSIAKNYNGFLTGQKVQFVKNLDQKEKRMITLSPMIQLRQYHEKIIHDDLIDLIIQGGIYSRFFTDPKITRQQYENLHRQWITNSIQENALFILEKKKKIIGFISLNEKMKRANIDFIVVDDDFRRQGLANVLMHHAHTWAFDNNYNQMLGNCSVAILLEEKISRRRISDLGKIIEK